MKRRRSNVQNLTIIKDFGDGSPTGELCRRHGIHPNMLRNRKAKFGGMTSSEVTRLKGLDNENCCLKRIVADQTLNSCDGRPAALTLELPAAVRTRETSQESC